MDRVKQFWGKSGDGAQGAKGFANEISSIDLAERQYLPLKRISPTAGPLKALYLATWELTKKWILPVRNWG